MIAGTAVAQRFIRRREETSWQFPPLAELTASALVVAGLCIVLRIGWPLVSDLLNTGSFLLSQSLVQFADRWPFVLLPFLCTYSIGLTCAYLGTRSWGWTRLILFGGLLNAMAFAIAALLISKLLSAEFLQGLLTDPNLKLVLPLSVAGFVLGAIVLAIFAGSICSPKAAVNFDPSRPLLMRMGVGSIGPTDGSAHVSGTTADRGEPRGGVDGTRGLQPNG